MEGKLRKSWLCETRGEVYANSRRGDAPRARGAGEYLIPLGCRPDGSQSGVPLIGLAGALPGSRLGIIAGIHGDEYEGPEAARALLAELDPAPVRGGIICAPVANVAAYEDFHPVGSSV
jgi:hypothetical protein